MLVLIADACIDPHGRMVAIGGDATYLKMPVLGYSLLHCIKADLNPFTALRQLVHHVFSQQIAEPLPVALLGARCVSAHSASGSRCLTQGPHATEQHRQRVRFTGSGKIHRAQRSN
ncbi:hypothetical protein [Micromonospora sp. NPDC005173]|uniref:hypothetical protein n=1 Tax=Micromonospora sp. NPDC005173 TaxID=3157165 RepID=UPI0033BC2378